MMIDAYDVLGVDVDADPEEIKKAFKRMSIKFHPDKVQGQQGTDKQCADATAKFQEIKAASDILQDADRKKIYDTFGVDCGEEKPEMEVWTIGLTHLLSPMGTFTLKTIVMRTVIWIVGFRYIGYLLLSAGPIAVVLYAIDFHYKDFKMRSEEGTPYLLGTGLVFAVVLVCWVWQLLADAIGVFFLASEVVDVTMFLQNWKLGIGAAIVSFFLAWLVRGWWFWILGFEVIIAIVMLVALTVATGLVGLWIEQMKTQNGDKLKEWRIRMRKQRKSMQDEVEVLKKKIGEKQDEVDGLKKRLQDTTQIGNGLGKSAVR